MRTEAKDPTVAARIENDAARNELEHAARNSLGKVGVKEAQLLVRREMFRAALVATSGNRHAAARLLGVDRRYVLKMAKENPELDRD